MNIRKLVKKNKQTFAKKRKLIAKHFKKAPLLRLASSVFCAFLVIFGLSYVVYSATTIGVNVSTGDLLVAGNATTTGNQVVSGTLNVSSTSTLAITSATLLTISGNGTVAGYFGIATTTPYYPLTVSGDSYFLGNSTTTGSKYIGSNLQVIGNQTIGSTLNVSATSTLATTTVSGPFTLSGIASFLSNLIVAGNATTTGNQVISGNLNVHGAFSPDNFTFNPAGIFTVNGTTTLATTSFLGDVDFNLKQIKNVVLEKLFNFPSSPVEGQMFWSTVTSTPYWYDASSTRWRTLKSEATIVVAASDSKKKKKADYICDGTADDVEIQVAIDAVNTRGGGKVQLLEGTYNLAAEASVIMKSSVELTGLGRGTVIKRTSGAASVINDTTGVTDTIISNLTVDGNKSVTSIYYPCGIAMSNTKRGIIDKVKIKNVIEDGIVIGGTAQYIIIRDSFIVDNGIAGSDMGIEIAHGGEDILIDGCTVTGGTHHGISLHNHGTAEGGATDGPHRVVINNCTLSSNAGSGININGAVDALSQPQDIVISNCIFNSNAFTGIIADTYTQRLLITQCVAYNNGSSNDEYGGFNIKTADSSVVDNLAYSNNKRNFYLKSNIVRGNRSLNAAHTGFYLSGTNAIIQGNYSIGSASWGYQLAGTNCRVDHNIASSTNGFWIRSSNSGGFFENNITTGTTLNDSITTKLYKNSGYTTENSGTATITSGNTSTTVTHGLNIKPATSTIAVVPTNNLGSATKFWISNVATTTFQINTDVDPGVSTAIFNWQIGSY
ncbi:MAG: right-handed parallel beta-helix repeat-containing protein [Chloroflexi bacterium]|nr:right-handed parallel beta-helix repeat-containing protein [Chloroflexota bacterium]